MDTIIYLISTLSTVEAVVSAVLLILFIISLGALLKRFSMHIRETRRYRKRNPQENQYNKSYPYKELA